MSLEREREGFDVRFNFWKRNAQAVCDVCGAEHVVTWSDDTPPTDPAFALWAWLREHAEGHWLELEEGGPE